MCVRGGGGRALRRQLLSIKMAGSEIEDQGNFSTDFQSYSDDQYCKEILQTLNSLRHEGSLCDVTLVVEGREFKAHRNVLAASSPYFRNMFTSEMREKTESKVTIEALTSSVMEDLLSFIYTGAVEIGEESRARDLLSAADYLMVPRLNKIAGDFLLRNLSVSTSISVYQLAVATRNDILKDGVQRFINKHFVVVAKSEEFVNLSADEVIEWISSDDIEIGGEDEMFEVVISWVEHGPDSRKDCLLGLLRHVRLTLLSPSYLISKVLRNCLIKDNQDCMELALKSMEVLLANQQDGSLSEKPRKCLETHVHCVFACGGHTRSYNESSNACCCFVPDEGKKGKWYSLENMMTKRTCHAVGSCQGLVYSLGGHVSNDICDKVERFHQTINSWVEIESLPIARMTFPGVSSLNGLLYVCGGYTRHDTLQTNRQYSKKVFAHNPNTNSWQECAPMIHSRAGLCVVAADQHIYAIGGEGERGVATDTVQRFDPRRNMWMLASSMTEVRKNLCGAAVRNKIFVFGGIGNSSPTHSAEMYDVEKDYWQEIANMQVPRVCAGAAVVQGLIYIIGGNRYSSSAPLKHKRMIECYDPSTGQWAEKGSFPCREFIMYCACCPVMIPRNLLESLPELS